MASHKMWDKRVWLHPRIHDFRYVFGLGIDDITKTGTIAPILLQDNALIDYETIKTNKENADFAVFTKPNCCAGSYVPKAMFTWEAWCPSAEIDVMRFYTMDIHTAMLNRLDAFDKKTGEDIETIIELTHETTDEQAYPLYDGTKLFEGHGVGDLTTDMPGLTTTGQLENVAFTIEGYFDALHYYTNREMLRTVTGRFEGHKIAGPLTRDINVREKIIQGYQKFCPGIVKYQHPYTFFGKLFHAPVVGNSRQYQLAAETSAIEHLTVECRVRFNEYNPDFNFSRA